MNETPKEDEADEDDYQSVGWYPVVDARRLLRALERQGVDFHVDAPHTDPAGGDPVAAAFGGAFGSGSKVQLHVHKDDLGRFHAIHDPEFSGHGEPRRASIEPPAPSEPPPGAMDQTDDGSPEPSPETVAERRTRTIELILVLVVAFGGYLAGSLEMFIYDSPPFGGGGGYMAAVVQEIGSLLLVVYLLGRREGGIASLGLRFKPRHVLHCIGLIVGGYILYTLAYTLLAPWLMTGRTAVVEGYRFSVTLPLVVFCLINPVFEEVIVRAFLITEVRFISGNVVLAVILSALLQSFYHLYQSVLIMVSMFPMFLLFSIYYARQRAIIPVIVAHLFFDVWGILLNGAGG